MAALNENPPEPSDPTPLPGEIPSDARPGIPPPLPVASPPAPRWPGPFWPWATVLFAIGALVTTIWQASNYLNKPRLETFYYPADVAIRLVDRTMEVQSITESNGGLMRLADLAVNGGRNATAGYVTNIFAEVLANTNLAPRASNDELRVRLHYAVVLGEVGWTNLIAEVIRPIEQKWEAKAPVRLLRAAYLDPSLEVLPDELDRSLSNLVEGWTQDRWHERLLRHAGRTGEAQWLAERAKDRAEARWRQVMAPLFIHLAVVGAGALLALSWWWRGRRGRPAEGSGVVAPWSGLDGFGVVVRVVSIGMAVFMFLSWVPLPFASGLATHFHSLVLVSPLLWLMPWYLLRPHGLHWKEYFGLDLRQVKLKVIAGGALIIVAVESLGYWLFLIVFDWLGVRDDWAEGVDEYMIFSSPLYATGSFLNLSLFGPVTEELFWRGIVYGTMRRSLGVWPAALGSSACFGFIHYYSLTGFFSVTLFGVLACLTYERTRSLLPCMAGHVLANALIGWTLLAAFG